MIWFVVTPILGILVWLVIAFMVGWAKGMREYEAVTFLLERPMVEWPHMSLGTLTEIDRLAGLIKQGKVLHIALWEFLERHPALRAEILRRAAVDA